MARIASDAKEVGKRRRTVVEEWTRFAIVSVRVAEPAASSYDVASRSREVGEREKRESKEEGEERTPKPRSVRTFFLPQQYRTTLPRRSSSDTDKRETIERIRTNPRFSLITTLF